ncbi:hypothetical protein [Falsirhodobacter sp. alg1]|uniref:hypothetical protein n=1 Tax=Falsirhodobacter sp. alg1 TaxID=1472418 RepID=UPI0005ED6EC3|nr:hypothetical protein [Falsirhodobacter sp. alg1]
MIYTTAREWTDAPRKRALLFGMSGLGKTHASTLLRSSGKWFHYSIDYRIGTRYMGEHIADNFKREAMKIPFLRELLMSDSVSIASNITFDNLSPLSTYLGKPGNPDKGGLPFDEYQNRQNQHTKAEIASLMDSTSFINRAEEIYGYPNFICDTGGSICEVVDAENPSDPVMTELSSNMLMVWIKGSEAHTEELVRRFDRAPKPMCYQPQFLLSCWTAYLEEKGKTPAQVDPDDFIRWTYARALAHRQPRYAAMSRWGVTVLAEDVYDLKDDAGFIALIAQALENRGSGA